MMRLHSRPWSRFPALPCPQPEAFEAVPAVPTASLTSVRSERVVAVRRLHDRSGRRKSGRFLVEGPQAVAAAFAAGIEVHEVFVDVDAGGAVMSIADQSPTQVTWTTSQVLVAMGETQSSQGILATCANLTAPELSDVMHRPGQVVVLDAVSDPGNVGTIIRTADATGAAAVILTDGCADPHNGKVVRSTAGSLFHVPVLTGASVADVIAAAHGSGRQVLALAGEGAVDVTAISAAELATACWIVGSEAHGVSPGARSGADRVVAIPMAGHAESLNAGVAASVALYASVLQAARTYGAPDSGVSPPG